MEAADIGGLVSLYTYYKKVTTTALLYQKTSRDKYLNITILAH